MNERRTFPPRFKVQVVLEVLKGKETLTDIAARYKMHVSQLAGWKKKFLENAETVFMNQDKTKSYRKPKHIKWPIQTDKADIM